MFLDRFALGTKPQMRPLGHPRPERSSLIGGLADEQGISLYDGHLQHQVRSRRDPRDRARRGSVGARRVMVVTDPNLAGSEPVSLVLDALREAGIDAVLFDQVEVEPTDRSFQVAIDFAVDGRFDGYVAVGGGSSIDTAKAANLYATYPAELLDYVNPPVGKGLPVPGQLKPLVAVPTTAGTGSETTGVAIFDYTPLHAKTGIAHCALRPVLGVIDPNNTRSVPPQVAACAGLDVLSHAVESLTALPFCQRPAPDSPAQRPAYQGSNPISDIWARRAIEMVARYLVRSTTDPSDDEAAERCSWRRPSPASDSATRACTYPTACRTRSRGWSATSSRRGTAPGGR